MNINEGNIDCNIYISSTTRISPPGGGGGILPRMGTTALDSKIEVQIWDWLSVIPLLAGEMKMRKCMKLVTELCCIGKNICFFMCLSCCY